MEKVSVTFSVLRSDKGKDGFLVAADVSRAHFNPAAASGKDGLLDTELHVGEVFGGIKSHNQVSIVLYAGVTLGALVHRLWVAPKNQPIFEVRLFVHRYTYEQKCTPGRVCEDVWNLSADLGTLTLLKAKLTAFTANDDAAETYTATFAATGGTKSE
jgi:hypothetical protein